MAIKLWNTLKQMDIQITDALEEKKKDSKTSNVER